MCRVPIPTVIATAATLIVVLAAFQAGIIAQGKYCSLLAGLAGVHGGCLLFVQGVLCVLKLPHHCRGYLILAFVVYGLFLSLVNPWLPAFRSEDLLYAMAWLTPMIVAGVVLPRYQSWLGAVGAWLFLFGGVIALSYNIHHINSAVGFFVWILD